VVFVDTAARKPAIYLYTPGRRKEELSLRVKGVITTRIPHRDGLTSIVWDNLVLEGGRILDGGESFDYLFYESKNVAPRHPNSGWVLRRKARRITWNGEPVDRDALALRFRTILKRYGLFENEVKDFIDYWLGADMKIFFDMENFAFGFFPISVEELDRLFAIETKLEYKEYIRVQFLVKEVPGGTVLAEPEFPEIVRSEYALHEWGIIKG
jgi:hypothetical protein